jgi:hypothetical protein
MKHRPQTAYYRRTAAHSTAASLLGAERQHLQVLSSCQLVECTPFRSSSQPGTTAAFPAEADRCSLSTKLPTALSLAVLMFMPCSGPPSRSTGAGCGRIGRGLSPHMDSVAPICVGTSTAELECTHQFTPYPAPYPYMLSCTSALVASLSRASCVRFCRQPEPYTSRRWGSSLSLVLQEGVLSFNMPEYHSLPLLLRHLLDAGAVEAIADVPAHLLVLLRQASSPTLPPPALPTRCTACG